MTFIIYFYSLAHSFTQQICIEQLLFSNYYSIILDYNNDKTKSLLAWNLPFKGGGAVAEGGQ
jgi:hypothetical protein